MSADDKKKCVVIVPIGTYTETDCERGLQELERRGYTVWRRACHVAIDMGRSQMASEALAAGFEEQMWIDADIGFDPNDVERLRAHEGTFVCGVYAKRGSAELACHVMPGTKELLFGEEGGLVEMLYVGMGFCLIRRAAFEAIAKSLPVCGARTKAPFAPYFLPMTIPHKDDPTDFWYLAEDYAFCERARAAGHGPFADTRIRLFHIGRYGYTWEDATGGRERYRNVKMLLK